MKNIIYTLSTVILFAVLLICSAGCIESGIQPVVISPSDSAVVSAADISENAAKRPFIIVIDPGHQLHNSSEQEPLGPGSSETKDRVTGGATGTATGLCEYELNLQVSFKLRALLEERGWTVIMTRTENDVDLSNIDRAMIANNAGADVFLRIHADSYPSSAVSGITTMCPTPDSPYCSQIYNRSRLLSECLLDAMVERTGANRREIQETDSMSGINWSQVPVCLIEMGFMSNPEEDMLMATEEYQQLLAEGIANGLDTYFALSEDIQ